MRHPTTNPSSARPGGRRALAEAPQGVVLAGARQARGVGGKNGGRYGRRYIAHATPSEIVLGVVSIFLTRNDAGNQIDG